MRLKLQEAACIDMGYDLATYALEFVRHRVEAAARRAREQVSVIIICVSL